MKKIILLGGNFESIPTILEAKKNYQVIVVDKNKFAPGFKHTHLQINESIDFDSCYGQNSECSCNVVLVYLQWL